MKTQTSYLSSEKYKTYLRDNQQSRSKILAISRLRLGDIKGRFEFIGDDLDFIYDNLLKGHWSRASANYVNYYSIDNEKRRMLSDFSNNQAKLKNIREKLINHECSWSLPNIFQLASLSTKKKNRSIGFIHEYFKDTDFDFFWSCNYSHEAKAWGYYYFSGQHTNYYKNNLYCRVRLFRADKK